MENGFFYPWGADLGTEADFDLKREFPPQLHQMHPRQLQVLADILAQLNIGIWPTDGHQDRPQDCRLEIAVFGPGDCVAGHIDLVEAMAVGMAEHYQCGPQAELIALHKVRDVIDKLIAARVFALESKKA